MRLITLLIQKLVNPSFVHAQRKGFTLIELLVVIAIIGILAAVVIASLNSARTKGNDAGVKANLHTVKTQAAIFNSNNGGYGTLDDGLGGPVVCPVPGNSGATVFHDTTVQNALASALVDSFSGTAVCLATADAFAAAVSRPNDGSTPPPSVYWCVDSAGNSCGVDVNTLVGASCGTCVTTN